MVVRWHELWLKDIDSIFRRIEDLLSIKEKLDEAIVSPDMNLGAILRSICSDYGNLVAALRIELLFRSDDELIPMGISKFDINYEMLLANLNNACLSSGHLRVANLDCFPIQVFNESMMLLIVERGKKSHSALRQAEFLSFTKLVTRQLGVVTTKYIEAQRAEAQNILIDLFFDNKLKPTTCWYQIVNQIRRFLPNWEPLLIDPCPKVQFLSYKQGDRYLKILATQGDEQIGTEVLVDSSISGMLVEDPSKDYICINPTQYLERYSAFLINSENKIPESELAVSVKHNGYLIGIINLEHPSPGVFKSQHIASVVAASCFLAPFVDALKVRHEVQRSKEIGILYTLSHLLGRSAQTYSHLLGQPIYSIRASLDRLQEAIQSGSPREKLLVQIDKIEQHLEEVVASSDRFCQSMPAIMDYGPVKVLPMIDGSLSLFNRATLEQDDSIRFDIQIDEDVPSVYASSLLQEHFYNLVNNSIYALREARSKEPTRQGVIKIVVKRREIKDKLNKATASKQVMFMISDNGTGVSPENESKLGQPRFTTKDQGTGFGLASAMEYVQSFGGHLTWTNKPGQGFIVDFYLEEYDKQKHG